jgi:hypothetical protein
VTEVVAGGHETPAMAKLRLSLWASLGMVVLCGCGGRTEVEGEVDSGGADAHTPVSGDSGGGTGPSSGSGVPEGSVIGASCAALGDCCYILSPAADAVCGDVVAADDDGACAAKLDALQSAGEC